MTALESDRPRRKAPAILLLLIIIGLLSGAYYLAPRFERDAPHITLAPDSDVLGPAPVVIGIVDQGTGLKSVTATLLVAGSDHTLAAEQYAEPVREKKVIVDPSKLAGVKDGRAVLRVSARDGSLWKFFGGNEAVFQKDLTIDITPPTVELIADDRYINLGGVGAIVYKASADTVSSGVRIADYFFPGDQGQVKDHPDRFIVFFAHPYNVAAEAKAVLIATDKAGNTREMPLVYELKNVKYRKSTIFVSDSFLQSKVAPLLTEVGAREAAPKEIFVAVNRRLRKQNEDKIAAITKKWTSSIIWEGAFTQLSNSKVEANFAEERTYTYNSEPIDTAYHLGYDLSVTKRYPVEAANRGNVAFVGDLGIYGNTVILDHGLGLFTLYSHLSSTEVKEGDSVKQRQIIGRTGETGLAGGDHLHYGVYLHGIAVLPVEWWDQKWINDNIQPKLEGHSKAIADLQQTKTRRKAAHNRRR